MTDTVPASPPDLSAERTLLIEEVHRIKRIHLARDVIATELQLLPNFIQKLVLDDLFGELKVITGYVRKFN